MNQTDFSLVERMRINTDAVIVNQCQRNGRKEFYHNGHRILWIDSTTRGLSVSRNICLEEAREEICLIADDDLEYISGYEKIIEQSFISNIKADIIRFQVEGIERPFKKYPPKKRKINALQSFKISSVEIAFRRERIGNIRFDELIGAGTEFCMGEENAFLIHCIQAKCRIEYIPMIISRLHIGQSSWKNITDEQYLKSRGAAFEAMNTTFVHALIAQFAIRKHRRYKKSYSIWKGIKIMEEGRKTYINKKNSMLQFGDNNPQM